MKVSWGQNMAKPSVDKSIESNDLNGLGVPPILGHLHNAIRCNEYGLSTVYIMNKITTGSWNHFVNMAFWDGCQPLWPPPWLLHIMYTGSTGYDKNMDLSSECKLTSIRIEFENTKQKSPWHIQDIIYPLVNQHSYGKSPFLIYKWAIFIHFP